MNGLAFYVLRAANRARLPQFRGKNGQLAHRYSDGHDWSPAQWLQAVIGELGEYANIRKKFERGDITAEEFAVLAAKELADVATYLDILASRCLDITDSGIEGRVALIHPTGVDLGEAIVTKFNEISKRAQSTVRIARDGRFWYHKHPDGSMRDDHGFEVIDTET